jgi:hypothetical protein
MLTSWTALRRTAERFGTRKEKGGCREGGRSALRAVLGLLAVGLCLYAAGWIYRIYLRQYYIWLPSYARWSLGSTESAPKPVHVMFLITAAFEPGSHSDLARRWEREYPLLAQRHRDSTGRPLQLSAFYPGDDIVEENLRSLQRLAAGGYAEVELHLHHLNDTPESALVKYRDAIGHFQTFGFLKTIDGNTHFGFAHGNSGLDNSLGPRFCGVNQELQMLQDLGCFADFTFPSIGAESQPSIINTIYEALDDERPKSYDHGTPLRLGQAPAGGLVIFPAPLVFTPDRRAKRLFVYLENSEIHPSNPVTDHRVDSWIRANIHVAGRPDWMFVRIDGHLASSNAEIDEALGPHFDQALSYLEGRYNDGVNYELHYVTAREAYNLARAAAAGQRGNPSQYLNWEIPPYVANARSSPPLLQIRTAALRH